MPDDKVRKYAALMNDESFVEFLDILGLNLPNPKRVKVPLLVMGGANDLVFRPAEVEATARAYNTQAIIFPNMAHGMMLEDGWQAVADRIIAWLNEKGLQRSTNRNDRNPLSQRQRVSILD